MSSDFHSSCSAADFKLVLAIGYSSALILGSSVPAHWILPLHFLHALFWRIIHSFVLGSLLKAQSRSKYLVRHFLKHYYYPPNVDGDSGAVQDAFNNWKEVYNLSLCMTYGEYAMGCEAVRLMHGNSVILRTCVAFV